MSRPWDDAVQMEAIQSARTNSVHATRIACTAAWKNVRKVHTFNSTATTTATRAFKQNKNWHNEKSLKPNNETRILFATCFFVSVRYYCMAKCFFIRFRQMFSSNDRKRNTTILRATLHQPSHSQQQNALWPVCVEEKKRENINWAIVKVYLCSAIAHTHTVDVQIA